jgi:methylated-DNA-[protein]-cysteine S-methyltransferase
MPKRSTALAETMPLDLGAPRVSRGDAPLSQRFGLTTPFGPVALDWRALGAAEAGLLTRVELAADALAARAAPGWLADAFAAYFDDPRQRITLPLAASGTPFQRRVWQAIAAIPCGVTRTYGELAHALGSAPRAVGGACRANPCPLVVPCHRVVGRQGLGGFAGARGGRLLAIKTWLLRHEGVLPAA